jgi:hypothetical protein
VKNVALINPKSRNPIMGSVGNATLHTYTLLLAGFFKPFKEPFPVKALAPE